MSDHDDATSRAWALRLALAACTDSLDGMRATVDDIYAERGCWGCISRALLDVLADVTDDQTVHYIEAMLAETLDAASGSATD